LGLAGKKPQTVVGPSSNTRLDPPHEPSDLASEPEREERTPEVEPVLDEGASEQLHLQADQLAAHLSSRQKELDHREAELNSRAAQLESGVRSARLWIIETESELDSRDKAIAEREREVERRLARLAATEAAIQKRTSPAVSEESVQEKSVPQDATTLVDYFATEHRNAMAELDEKRHALERRARRIDQCQAAFQKLRDEVEQMHREALEIRLGTEELWAELSGAAPPAALTRSLGRIRAKLAEQYRQANAELEERKKEIESLRRQMAEEYRNLAEHKERFEQWYAGRQEELDRQATRLIAREKQLQK
jgi:chromosome segregation ATPase